MILLVKHGYGTEKWSLPGGGIKQAELAPAGAIREVFDETGLSITVKKQIAYLSLEQKYGFTSLFEGEIVGGFVRQNGDGQEILACKYFHKNNLPEMYNAQRGMIGWSEYHKDDHSILYGHPNKPPIKEFSS
ncbi:MAG: NUDIX domain-containing protein [Candidatus Yanofskybacteria bacterium]|nr:NUDIX domain-containing protein [Candidatus Yanofskybacteria bacterium]